MGLVKISVTTLKPVHIIGKYLGIWPSFNTNTMEKCGCPYVHGIIALAIIICEFVYVLCEKITYHDKIDNSVFVMILLSDIATTMTNITSIININFLQGERLHKFLQQLQHLESIFRNVNKDEGSEERQFYIHLATAHTVFFFYMMYNLWVWTHTLGWDVSRYTLLRDLQFYHVFMTVLLIRAYVLLIKYKVEAVNYVLENYTNYDINDVAKGENVFVISSSLHSGRSLCGSAKNNMQIIVHKQQWSLEYISKIYTMLTNVVNEFNEIFGWNLVVLIIQLIVNLLLALNLALVYGGGEKIMGTSLDYNLYILCFIWFAIPLMNMITVISACDRTKREMAKIPTICYNLILESSDQEFIKKVKDIALQGHLQAPEFTAAGFFSFNYSLVFPTMTSIISYFIVLVQFKS